MMEGMTERVRDFKREMKGWDFEERPDLLLDDENDELGDDNGPDDLRCDCNREVAPTFEIKAKDGESVSVFILFAKEDVEAERKKETDDFEEGRDVKEKFRMAIKKLTSERQVEAPGPLSTCCSQISRGLRTKALQNDHSGKRSHKSCLYELGLSIKERKTTWHKSC